MQKQKCNKTSSSFGLVSSVLDWRLQCVQMIQPEYVCYVCVCVAAMEHMWRVCQPVIFMYYSCYALTYLSLPAQPPTNSLFHLVYSDYPLGNLKHVYIAKLSLRPKLARL